VTVLLRAGLFSALACLAALFHGAAAAQPVKCVDAKGKTRYIDASAATSNEKCVPVKDAMNVVGSQAQPATGGGAAAGDGERRTNRNPGQPASGDTDKERLAGAQIRLEHAKRELAAQEAIREGGEKNYERVLERLKPFQEAVQRAEKEISELQQQR
jgi:hypothetical protein